MNFRNTSIFFRGTFFFGGLTASAGYDNPPAYEKAFSSPPPDRLDTNDRRFTSTLTRYLGYPIRVASTTAREMIVMIDAVAVGSAHCAEGIIGERYDQPSTSVITLPSHQGEPCTTL